MPDALCAVAQFVQVLTPAEFKVFVVIASTAWSLGTDETRASWDALQAVTGLGRTTVYEALKGIEAKEVVVPLGRPHGVRATVYRIPCLSALLPGNVSVLRADPVPLGRGSDSEPLEQFLVPLGRGSDSEPVLLGRGSDSERVSEQNPARGSDSEPLAAGAYKESLTHSLTHKKIKNEKVSECSATCARVADAVQKVFAFHPASTDPKIVQLTQRIEQLDLPVISLVRYLRHLRNVKRSKNYLVESFGAVFIWTVTEGGLMAWKNQQDPRMFELDWNHERGETNEHPEVKPIEKAVPLSKQIDDLQRWLTEFSDNISAPQARAQLADLQQQLLTPTTAAGGSR